MRLGAWGSMTTVTQILTLNRVGLWSAQRPKLYDVVSTVTATGTSQDISRDISQDISPTSMVDSVRTSIGFRKVVFDGNKRGF